LRRGHLGDIEVRWAWYEGHGLQRVQRTRLSKRNLVTLLEKEKILSSLNGIPYITV